jgi:hypothetical protein
VSGAPEAGTTIGAQTMQTSVSKQIFSMLRSLDLLQWLCILAVFTVSFDIFLVLNLGFNFRATQILLFLPIGAVFADFLMHRRWVHPPGLVPLAIWTVFILAYIPNSGFLPRGAAYGFWLIFNVLTVITMTRVFAGSDRALTLMRFYLLSFLFVAAFGIMQFVLPLLRITPPLVTQYWFFPLVARINGFSYEPSYFSSYLIMGWVLHAWLLKRKEYLIGRRALTASFWVLTVALILSSSRMGWILMLLWFLHHPLYLLGRALRGRLNLPAFKATALLAGLALFVIFAVVNVIGVERATFLVAGLGIAGQAGHSSEGRMDACAETLQIFANSPIVGCSLGGVAPAIGQLRGVTVTDIDSAKENEGMSVFAEVLAASGAFGVVPFIAFLVIVFRTPLKLAKDALDRQQSVLLKGMVLSLLFELIILQMNQNILRPYLWMHIAILSALCASVRRPCAAT